METKSEQNIFEYIHPITGDVFIYKNDGHAYKLNGIDLPGTTTPLTLINELSFDSKGKMSDKTSIIKNWALKVMFEKATELFGDRKSITKKVFNDLLIESKKAPNQRFKDAGLSGTEIHELLETEIKNAIDTNGGYINSEYISENKPTQVLNFVKWAVDNKVKFLFSEEPLYSKEWMNCGTVDFICEIDGKILIGDIKTNGDKRRYEWTGSGYDFSKPISDIHTIALWQTGAYGKMATEDNARKLIPRFDGVVVVNIKKSGEFDEKLDVRYDYNPSELVEAYGLVIKLYKLFRNKI